MQGKIQEILASATPHGRVYVISSLTAPDVKQPYAQKKAVRLRVITRTNSIFLGA